MAEVVRSATSLFPHANPGIMSLEDIRALRPLSPSMGLMLENVSTRLTAPGMPHDRCPDKDPRLRMATIRAAAEARVPFTTGILVGIGETSEELVESLFALRDLAAEGGHVQEVIVQNFRAKADTRKRRDPEPTVDYMARVVAIARWILGPEMNLQVPPNLTERFEVYLDAGINDWGGVSPITIDWVNPEAPWPHLEELQGRTEAAGFTLRARLPVYPEYLSTAWIDEDLWPDLSAAADDDGYALAPHLLRTWRGRRDHVLSHSACGGHQRGMGVDPSPRGNDHRRAHGAHRSRCDRCAGRWAHPGIPRLRR
jgi:FO synthase